MKSQGLDDYICKRFSLNCPEANLSEWEQVIYEEANPAGEVTIGMVGKYIELPDAYKSVIEALKHGGLKNRVTVNIKLIDSQDVETRGVEILKDLDAILILAASVTVALRVRSLLRAMRVKTIFLTGICTGMQVALIEFARNVAGMDNANSTEFVPDCKYPVVALITEWRDEDGNVEVRSEKSDLGGTMRLGAQQCQLTDDSTVRQLYGAPTIVERHRHRYEVNNMLLKQIEAAGLRVAGRSGDDQLVEIIEVPNHPWFVACQFHPEFTSTPRDGHPLFAGFVKAASEHQKRQAK